VSTAATPTPAPLSKLQVGLILTVAVIGFAFDIYELLMLPMIFAPAISELLQVPIDNPAVREWFTIINAAAAVTGGIFGLLGGYLIDRFGRKKILLASILLYGVSPVLAAFSTDIYSFMIFRCTTFIGVCVEFIAAVAWLAELFPEKKKREAVLGSTQAFSSFGGLMVAGMYALMVDLARNRSLPALPVDPPYNGFAAWRYTLITGLIPAIPILFLLPFLPESPIWRQKKAAGTLKRASFGQIFAPDLRRTTIVATLLFACCYGAAFGAIQLAPQGITPGLPEFAQVRKDLDIPRKEAGKLNKEYVATEPGSEAREKVRTQLAANSKQQAEIRKDLDNAIPKVQLYQEMGGLMGRIALAVLALYILSRRVQLWLFVVPGMFILPYFFWTVIENDLTYLYWGLFAAAFVTVAQYSYWGNYLPAAYPVHLRGTAGGFAANIGGRMIGSSIGLVTTFVVAPMITASTTFESTAKAAAIVGGSLFVLAFIVSFWLPEPKESAE
jgi:MFS family permease